MELSLNMMNMPTRKEIDEIHKTIYELRKEIKQLKSGDSSHGNHSNRSGGNEIMEATNVPMG